MSKKPQYQYKLHVSYISVSFHKGVHDMWSDNNVRELIAVNVLHTSLLNTTVVTFKVLPLGCYEPMPAPSPPLQNNFGNGFVEWPSELPLYYF